MNSNSKDPLSSCPALVTKLTIDTSRLGGNLTRQLRDLEWVKPKEIAIDDPFRRKAAKIYAFGTICDVAPCERCAKGRGPFHKCIVAWDNKGYIAHGNCANCYWIHRTDACTRRAILPCKALQEMGEDLGAFEEACRIHCKGAHIAEKSSASADEQEDSSVTSEASKSSTDGSSNEDKQPQHAQNGKVKASKISTSGSDTVQIAKRAVDLGKTNENKVKKVRKVSTVHKEVHAEKNASKPKKSSVDKAKSTHRLDGSFTAVNEHQA